MPYPLAVILLIHTVLAGVEKQQTAWKATETPCCTDTLLPQVCKSLYNRDHDRFARMCRSNADFSFIQCCYSCHFNPDLFTTAGAPVPRNIYKQDVEELLLKPNPNVCFDRHGPAFCEMFVTRTGPWARSQVNCDHTAFAFRVCRKTCGYCTGNKPATVQYDAATAKDTRKCRRMI